MLDVGNSLSSSIDAVPNSTPHTSKFIRRYLPKANYVSARGSMPGFVTAPGDGHLYLDGQLFDFRSFNTPTLFEGKEFQARDLVETISAFGSPVTRTYTLHVVNSMFTDGKQESSSSHILGWDNSTNDWIYNEMNWRNIDSAASTWCQNYNPIINQDYGTYDSNWVGNYNDLIRHRNQTSVRFDTQEVDVINSTYDASYRILGLTPPAKPVPGTPEAFLVSNGTHAGISWRGAAWAQAYEVLGAVFEDVEFSTISRYVADNFEAGQLFVPLDPTDPTKPIHITLPKTIPHGSHADKKPPVTLRRLTRMRAPREQLSAKNRNLHRTAQDRLITGGWFSVRAIGADGVPGGVSDSIFLKSQWEPHLGEVTGGAAAAKKDRSPPGM
ncbi:hypothetical protein KEM48_011815 [Puccinia striiformis f. sp. tritici PST-130]|nr:hypothetical protein KEM48_011815 [Puccinia striiformis f. sp. tritici PST-130]